MRKLIAIVVVPILIGLVVVAIGWSFVSERGVSAREEPSEIEKVLARRMRHLAIPRGARDEKNPVASSPEAIEEGLAHFADHCAICHANDGSGDSEIGRNMYPKPPDMRAADTQSLTDGELFYVIENGVRLTGMPAWGAAQDAGKQGTNPAAPGEAHSTQDTWRLVHFIRHLPKLTAEERTRMAALNPKSADEWRELEASQKGDGGTEAGQPGAPPATKPHTHSHSHEKPHQH